MSHLCSLTSDPRAGRLRKMSFRFWLTGSRGLLKVSETLRLSLEVVESCKKLIIEEGLTQVTHSVSLQAGG